MKKLLSLIAFSVFLLIPLGAQDAFSMEQTSGPISGDHMVTVAGPNGWTGYAAPLYTTQNNPIGYVVAPGGTLDGVGDITFTSSAVPGNFRCSGSLLESDPLGGDDDTIVLTAAHCVDSDLDGVIDLNGGSVKFEGAAGDEVIAINVAWTMVFPGWNGDFIRGDDIAIIELVSAPSSSIDRYVYNTNPAGDASGDADQIGYGRTGFLATGDLQASGIKHAIINDRDGIADATALAFGSVPVPGYGFVTDGDNGLVANDACGITGLCTPGLGNGDDEGLSAGGDSGGPTFAQGAPGVVIGVTSWGGTFIGPGSPDVNAILDSSHGELAVYTRVSQYSTWITDTLISLDKLDPGPQTPQPPGGVVAGELLSIDNTSLLLAGAQMNAVWIIPMIVAAAAIGIVVSRRF